MNRLIRFLVLFIPGAVLILIYKEQILYYIKEIPYLVNSFPSVIQNDVVKIGTFMKSAFVYIFFIIIIILLIKYREQSLRRILERGGPPRL